MNREEQMQAVQVETLELFKKKNIDYGDSFADYGVVGVLVRMSDKIKRFMSVSDNGISLVNDEALRDTLIDLHNYSAMAIMLMDEKKTWIEEQEKIYAEETVKQQVEVGLDGTNPTHTILEECGPMPTASQATRDKYIKAFEDAKGMDIVTVDVEDGSFLKSVSDSFISGTPGKNLYNKYEVFEAVDVSEEIGKLTVE